MGTDGNCKSESSEHLSPGKKIIYGLGAVAENTMQNGINSMANPFFNVALGVSPALIGVATSVFRLWDAMTDLLMGLLSDRTESRFGRRRPYIVAGAVAGAFLFALMWWCPLGMNPLFYFGWFLIISLLFYTAFTVFGVPYLALGYELSPDYHERTRVMSCRTWFASVSGISIQWTFWLTQRSCFNGTVDGMRWVGVGVAILLILTGTTPGIFLKERRLTENELAANREKIGLKSMLSIFSVQPFWYVLGALTMAMLGLFLVGVLGFYINVYYVFGGDLKAASTMIGASGSFYHICCMASVPLISWISTHFGKKRALLLFMFISMLGTLLKWFLYTPSNPWLQLIVTGLMAPGLSAVWTLLASMTADVTDFDELGNGTRREGSFGAIYGWTMKLGFALCSLVAGFVLVRTGFDAELGGNQPERTLFLMRLLYSVIPALGLLGAMICISRFPLTEALTNEIRKKLDDEKI